MKEILLISFKNGQVKYFKMITCEQSASILGEVKINICTITGQFLYSQFTIDYRSYLDNSDLANGV